MTIYQLFCRRSFSGINSRTFFSKYFSRSVLPTNTVSPHVCIVGSGPAGFYTAQHLLKVNQDVMVDVYEKLPVPFGLARFGIAPDHVQMKNCMNKLTNIAKNARCRFIGNVNVGHDITLSELRDAYDAVILSYGSEGNKVLGIPGEDLIGVYAAKEFIGWYNGRPENAKLNPDLSTDTVVVLGHGNVALDVARILLSDISFLQKTDICSHAIETLRKSNVKTVHIIGRRGPLQVSFNIKVLREMTKLAGCRPHLRPDDFRVLDGLLASLQRPRKRLTELMYKTALDKPSPEEQKKYSIAKREWRLTFFRNPIEFLPSSDKRRVGGVRFRINKLEESPDGTIQVVPTRNTENIPCGMVLRSIGFKNFPVDDDLPFDNQRGVIKNINGRVADSPGLYCCGWVKMGPAGAIANTMNDAFELAKNIAEDLSIGAITIKSHSKGYDVIKVLLDKRGVKTVNFSQWELINSVEQQRGRLLGKPREKITSTKEMMKVANS